MGKRRMSMSQDQKPRKSKPVDRATPVIRKPKRSDRNRITVTRSITSTMKESARWGASPNIQAVASQWNATADGLEANAAAIAELRAKLATLEAAQRVLRHDWAVDTKLVLATVAKECQGSPD